MTTLAVRTARAHYAWIILAIGALVSFGALGLARFGYGVILPAMQTSLAMTNTQTGALATANLIGYLTVAVASGALAARYGPRRVIVVGLAVAGAGMLLTGWAQAFLPALVLRGLTGAGSGASNVPVMGLLAAWFAAGRRGLAAGLVVGGSSVGLIVAGPLVPRLLDAYGEAGWRLAWFLFGGTTLALALLSWLALRDRPDELELAPAGPRPERRSLASRSQPSPAESIRRGLPWGQVYRSPVVWRLGFVYAAFGFAYIIYMTFFTKSLMADGGYSQAAAGALFMLLGWLSLVSGLIWGSVSDVIGRQRALISVYLIHAAAYGLFGVWPAAPGFTLSAILFGLAAWSVPAIMAATCGDLLGPRLAPAALGFITLFFGLGQAIGPSVAGAIADAAGTFTPAFALAGIVALLGAASAARLRPVTLAEFV
ncbi:MAG: MFS transporter [Anaerolineales bacterium]|nr:MFS transporter [Anaerolineales bacterium]